jgi:hypothetical protein
LVKNDIWVFLLNKEMVDEGRRQAKGTGQTLAEAFAKGYKDRLASESLDKEYEKFMGGKRMSENNQRPNPLAQLAGMDWMNPMGGGSGGGDNSTSTSPTSDTKRGIEAVNSGNKTINVTVNMRSGVESIDINVQRLDEGLGEVEQKVTEVLARIVNGATYSVIGQ